MYQIYNKHSILIQLYRKYTKSYLLKIIFVIDMARLDDLESQCTYL